MTVTLDILDSSREGGPERSTKRACAADPEPSSARSNQTIASEEAQAAQAGSIQDRSREEAVVVPDAESFDQAGRALQKLRECGREIRRSSLVNDVLIALSARMLGATVFTSDEAYQAIRAVVDFKLEMVAR